MGARNWVKRVFAVIGAIASIVTIIAWVTSGAVAYPIIVNVTVPSGQTATVTTTSIQSALKPNSIVYRSNTNMTFTEAYDANFGYFQANIAGYDYVVVSIISSGCTNGGYPMPCHVDFASSTCKVVAGAECNNYQVVSGCPSNFDSNGGPLVFSGSCIGGSWVGVWGGRSDVFEVYAHN